MLSVRQPIVVVYSTHASGNFRKQLRFRSETDADGLSIMLWAALAQPFPPSKQRQAFLAERNAIMPPTVLPEPILLSSKLI